MPSRIKKKWKVLAAGLVLSIFSWSVAHAAVDHVIDQQALQLGASLYESLRLGQPQLQFHSELQEQEITVNGLHMKVQSVALKTDAAGLEKMFDSFRENCQKPHHDNQVAGAPNKQPAIVGSPSFEGHGQQDSYLYCLKLEREISSEGLQKMFEQFERSRDLHEIGQFHGIFVRSAGNQHMLLMMQSQGSFRALDAFSSNHDAPGVDLSEIPRPQGRRLLSIEHNGQGSLTSYEKQGTPQVLLKSYQEQLLEAGYVYEKDFSDLASASANSSVRTSLFPASSKAAGSMTKLNLNDQQEGFFLRTSKESYIVVAHRPGGDWLSTAAQPKSRLSILRLLH